MIPILFLTANPVVGTDEPPLKLYREFESIDEKIWESTYRNEFELIPRFSSSARKLSDYVIRFKPNIVHFSGHGTAKGELVFQDEYGVSQVANASAIKNIFGILLEGIRCVVLNSCFSERQARMISKHVDCVIGIADGIYDQAALTLSFVWVIMMMARCFGIYFREQRRLDLICNSEEMMITTIIILILQKILGSEEGFVLAVAIENEFGFAGLIERARFSFLPLEIAAKYSINCLIDSRKPEEKDF